MSIRRSASIALIVFICPFLGAAQERPQFEVAAIRPSADALSGDFVLGLNAKGSQVHISWASLADLVNMAYRVKRYQISGPPWLGADQFTEWFSNFLDRPVLNTTDLKGYYDFQLKLTARDFQTMWMWAAIAGGANVPPPALVDGLSLESLPQALKTLGFKLERGRGFIDVLVIDAVQRTPTEN